MDVRTLEYKMKDAACVELSDGICLLSKSGKLNPISLYVKPCNKYKDGFWHRFKSYQEVYDFIMPDGMRISGLIDALTDEDFRKPMRLHS